MGSLEQLGPCAGTLWGCAQLSWATELGHQDLGTTTAGTQMETGQAGGAEVGECCVLGCSPCVLGDTLGSFLGPHEGH